MLRVCDVSAHGNMKMTDLCSKNGRHVDKIIELDHYVDA
jgi:hypothetical protein